MMASHRRTIDETPSSIIRESALGLAAGVVAGLADLALMGLGLEIGSQPLFLGTFVFLPILVAAWVGLGLWRKARWRRTRVWASNGLALGVVTFVGGLTLSLVIFRHVGFTLFGPL